MDSRGMSLVIEDDRDVRNLLCLILFNAGFEIHAEATGMEGLRAAKRLNLSLITLDLGLPDMDGRDVALQVRKISQAPLVIITAFAGADAELDGIASGATSYLSKPFHPARLRALIDELCPPQHPASNTGPDKN
jgi:two-component system OmpR family response regulator